MRWSSPSSMGLPSGHEWSIATGAGRGRSIARASDPMGRDVPESMVEPYHTPASLPALGETARASSLGRHRNGARADAHRDRLAAMAAERGQSLNKTLMAQPATPPHESGPESRSGLSWERGHLARNGPKARAPRKTAQTYFHGN